MVQKHIYIAYRRHNRVCKNRMITAMSLLLDSWINSLLVCLNLTPRCLSTHPRILAIDGLFRTWRHLIGRLSLMTSARTTTNTMVSLSRIGTDTMAYTASALSFMLENLGKPVIVTGSRRSHLVELRSDGPRSYWTHYTSRRITQSMKWHCSSK